jgi:phosphohistidine phosphatase SixA
MRRSRPLRSVATLTRVVLALLAFGALPAPALAQADAVVIYLVRHSERAEDGTNDPPISQAGEERSAQVAMLLQDAGITHIHTTDFKRTRATGAPTSAMTGLPMKLYDPRDLAAFAGQLSRTPGRHLVLGHSNTTPQLVEALGGDPGTPIEEMEYDRLYIVTLTAAGASTVLLRFGSPYEG